MAIDFNEVFHTAEEMHGKVSDLLVIVELARIGAVAVEQVGTFKFTVAQKTALKNKYNSLKAELINLYQALP